LAESANVAQRQQVLTLLGEEEAKDHYNREPAAVKRTGRVPCAHIDCGEGQA
jgi:hypothetical protein